MQKITPFLWFDTQAEEAANFYVSIFPNSKILSVNHTPEGKAFTLSFELNGQKFSALNGGPIFQFSEAISLFVDCRDQEEVDYYWEKLGNEGQYQQCGWLKDKYGISWQIIPKALGKLLEKDNTGKVAQAMMEMVKIDVARLEAAYNHE